MHFYDSSNGKSVVYIPGHSPLREEGIQSSAQKAEIREVILAFENVTDKFNLYTDSKYVVNLFPALETALLSGHSHVLGLLQQLQGLIRDRTKKFYVGHIRGHSNLPGPLSKRNYMANALARVINIVKAKESH